MNLRLPLIWGSLCLLLFLPLGLSAQSQPSQPISFLQDSLSTSLRVYPNPVTQSARFNLPAKEAQACHLYLVDVEGKVVRTITNLQGPEVEISLKDIPKGLYLVELRGSQSYYTRILIE